MLQKNKWIGSDKKQWSISAKKGSSIRLGDGNIRNGSEAELKKMIKSDESSVIENNQKIIYNE